MLDSFSAAAVRGGEGGGGGGTEAEVQKGATDAGKARPRRPAADGLGGEEAEVAEDDAEGEGGGGVRYLSPNEQAAPQRTMEAMQNAKLT
jgi:hypothetical protein